MTKQIQLTETLAAVETYKKAVEAGMNLDGDEIWEDVLETFKRETGIKIKEPTPFEKIKWAIKDFFQKVAWFIEDNFLEEQKQ